MVPGPDCAELFGIVATRYAEINGVNTGSGNQREELAGTRTFGWNQLYYNRYIGAVAFLRNPIDARPAVDRTTGDE
jgi:hypothetical protein